jgi:hypothetical protein
MRCARDIATLALVCLLLLLAVLLLAMAMLR